MPKVIALCVPGFHVGNCSFIGDLHGIGCDRFAKPTSPDPDRDRCSPGGSRATGSNSNSSLELGSVLEVGFARHYNPRLAVGAELGYSPWLSKRIAGNTDFDSLATFLGYKAAQLFTIAPTLHLRLRDCSRCVQPLLRLRAGMALGRLPDEITLAFERDAGPALGAEARALDGVQFWVGPVQRLTLGAGLSAATLWQA